MKKTLLILFVLCITPGLCGCKSLYAEHREVEQLRVVQTIGLDPAPLGVRLSLATSSGIGANSDTLCYTAVGASVSDAMDRLRDRSLEEALFCGHLQHILLGEETGKKGLDGILAYVCRSSDVRLDMPMVLVLGSTAQEAMTATGAGEKGIAEALDALEEKRGESQISTAGVILRDLERQGCSLIRTLRLQRSSEEGAEVSKTVVPEGFGVLVDGKLAAQLGLEDALAVSLLTGTLSPSPLVVYDEEGQAVTLELQEGHTAIQPVWDEDGSLTGLDIDLRVQAAVLEIDGFDAVTDSQYADALTARLETAISQRVGTVLRLSRKLEADFLGLGTQVERISPRRGRGMAQGLGSLLPDLELSISVRSELRHSNDIN